MLPKRRISQRKPLAGGPAGRGPGVVREITSSAKAGSKIMDFDTWLQQKGITGRVPRQAAIKLQDQWMKDTKGGANFQPQIVPVTNPITQEVSPAC